MNTTKGGKIYGYMEMNEEIAGTWSFIRGKGLAQNINELKPQQPMVFLNSDIFSY